jgi:alpha-galactosidase
MRDALYMAGRPILFSICEWGGSKPWLWAGKVGHSWRTTGDICASFDKDVDHGNWKTLSVMSILESQDTLRKYAGPGHWNDPDMLEVGNGMSVNEDRAHFTMWCMLAAPLILGNDLVNISNATLKIITNKDVIAIDQDTLGVQGLKYKADNGVEYWFKPLAEGDWAFAVLNRNDKPSECRVDWRDFIFTDNLSGRGTAFDKKVYGYLNLWDKSVSGDTQSILKVTIPAHDVAVYRLTPIPD